VGWVEASARMHNRLMHTLNGNTTGTALMMGDIFSTGGGGGGASSHMTITQALSMVPPVPDAVKNLVASTPFGEKHPTWHSFTVNTEQLITALVLIEQSYAGRAWGVKLADIPMGIEATDCRYLVQAPTATLLFKEACICVEWFFKRSSLSYSSQMVDVKWADSIAYQGTGVYSNPIYSAIKFTCDAVARMIYAAQLQEGEVKDRNSSLYRVAAVEGRMGALEARIAALESQKSKFVIRGAPTVTCLMHLFALRTSLDIPPHTERIADLSDAAEDWLRDQLKSRKVWVKVKSVDSAEENHISWAPLEGGEVVGAGLIRKYGSHRFW